MPPRSDAMTQPWSAIANEEVVVVRGGRAVERWPVATRRRRITV
jgi:hypothetical protein